MLRNAISFCIIVTLMLSCGQDSGENEKNRLQDSSDNVPITSKSDSVRVLTLPTPMQIPAVLKNARIVYAPDKMLPIRTIEKTYFKSSILFGAYLMDMAYASSYSHHQASIDYFKACQGIGEDLGLGATMTEGLYKRFQRNINAPDSLGRMILKVYDGGHKLLIHQEKEGLGLLMVMGCYMEGLHLTMNQVRQNDLILFVHLLNQNRNYGQNLALMLADYEIPDEVNADFQRFATIVQTLNEMTIPTIYDLKTGGKSIASIKESQIDVIQSELEAFRQNIIR